MRTRVVTWISLALETQYLVVVTCLQALVAALIVATGRREPARLGFALILGLSGLEALHFLTRGRLLPPAVLDVVDTTILGVTALLLAELPTPVLPRRRLAVVVAAGAFLLVSVIALATDRRDGENVASYMLFHESMFALGALLLAFHFVPCWTKLPRGPYRSQMLLAGSGLAITLAYQAGNFALSTRYMLAVDDPFRRLGGVWHVLTAWGIIVALLQLARASFARRDRDAAAFAIVLGTGCNIAIAERLFLGGILSEIASQALRPLFVGLAMLRFDLFAAPVAVRRVMVPVVAALFAVDAFVLLASILGRTNLADSSFEPGAVFASVVVLAIATALGWRAIGSVLAASRDPTSRRDRLERYRLGFERLHREPAESRERALAELRGALAISVEEHETIAAILAKNFVVPTSAIEGAKAGDEVAGHVILRELGRGGFGRALLARNTATGAFVVLKETLRPWEDDAAIRRAALRREAAAGAIVRSPRVARVIGVIEGDYNTYLAREYVAGETLADLVAREGALHPRRALGLGLDILEGLSALHAARVLHLDLKPENVIVDADGRAVLIDGGFRANERTGATAGGTLGASRIVGGTLEWMAPEQRLGRPGDARSDQYSAAAILRYALTGLPPSSGTDSSAGPETEDSAPRSALAALRRALNPSPEARFGSVPDLGLALADAASHLDVAPRTPS